MPLQLNLWVRFFGGRRRSAPIPLPIALTLTLRYFGCTPSDWWLAAANPPNPVLPRCGSSTNARVSTSAPTAHSLHGLDHTAGGTVDCERHARLTAHR